MVDEARLVVVDNRDVGSEQVGALNATGNAHDIALTEAAHLAVWCRHTKARSVVGADDKGVGAAVINDNHTFKGANLIVIAITVTVVVAVVVTHAIHIAITVVVAGEKLAIAIETSVVIASKRL